ncbi:T9SS C-terminal target domain-containing protein [bacterium]|nr:MAG: T9SS C-terminal target domain-containing protein [bacterium]
MRTLATLFAVVALLLVHSAQALGQVLSDDFTGLIVGNLAGQSSWTKGGTGPDVTVANITPLTRSGYNGGGGEYVVMPAPSATSSRVYETFAAPVTSYNGTTFYFSFLLNLSSTSTTATNYFISLGNSGTGTSYGGKLFARTSGNGCNIGLSKTSNTAVFGATVLNLNTTYLIVVRYTFNLAGTTAPNNLDDIAYLWIDPVLTSEPTVASAECSVPAAGTDTDFDGFSPAPADVGNFIWHNRGLGNPTGSFDGIRIGNGATSAAAWTNLKASTVTDVEAIPHSVPTEFALSKNYPNPFNPSTQIQYTVTSTDVVQLRIYDALGRLVTTLVNSVQHPGTYSVRWNAERATSGVYFCRLQATGKIESQKMLLVR